jgi:hypothetical protein
MVQLPQKLRVHISTNGEPLPGMLAWATIETNYKNPFTVVIGPTDAAGNACLSREEILEQTESDRQLFIMDYADPEVSATGRIVIQLMLLPDIERALQGYEQFHLYTRYPEGYKDNLNRAARCLEQLNDRPLSLSVASEGYSGEVATAPANRLPIK